MASRQFLSESCRVTRGVANESLTKSGANDCIFSSSQENGCRKTAASNGLRVLSEPAGTILICISRLKKLCQSCMNICVQVEATILQKAYSSPKAVLDD